MKIPTGQQTVTGPRALNGFKDSIFPILYPSLEVFPRSVVYEDFIEMF